MTSYQALLSPSLILENLRLAEGETYIIQGSQGPRMEELDPPGGPSYFTDLFPPRLTCNYFGHLLNSI